MLHAIADCIYDLLPVSRFEKKLRGCTRYRHYTVKTWKKQLGFSSSTANKILDNLEIFDGNLIHDLIQKKVDSHPEIFLQENCYIAPFHNTGKSGHNIFY
jgi:hypothetical protein